MSEIVPVAARVRQRMHETLLFGIALFGLLSLGAFAQRADIQDNFLYPAIGIAVLLPLLIVLGGWADSLRQGKPSAKGPLGSLMLVTVAVLMLLAGAGAGVLRVLDPFDLLATSATDGVFNLVVLAAVAGGIGGTVYWSAKLTGRLFPESATRTLGAAAVRRHRTRGHPRRDQRVPRPARRLVRRPGRRRRAGPQRGLARRDGSRGARRARCSSAPTPGSSPAARATPRTTRGKATRSSGPRCRRRPSATSARRCRPCAPSVRCSIPFPRPSKPGVPPDGRHDPRSRARPTARAAATADALRRHRVRDGCRAAVLRRADRHLRAGTPRRPGERPDAVWIPPGTISLVPGGMMMLTMAMSVVIMQWAVYAIARDDRPHAYLALGLTGLFGAVGHHADRLPVQADGLRHRRDRRRPVHLRDHRRPSRDARDRA